MTDADDPAARADRGQPPDPRDPGGPERGRPARGQHQRGDRPSARHPARRRPPLHRARRAHRRRAAADAARRTGSCPWCRRWAWTATARTYRVNSDAVALEVAKALGAVKLVYITTADGLVVSGTVARQLSVDELAERAAEGRGAAGPGLEGAPRGGRLPGRACRACTSSTAGWTRGCWPRSSRTRASAPSSTRTSTARSGGRASATCAASSSSSRPRWRARSCCRARARPSSGSSTTTTSSRSTGTPSPASPCTSTRRRSKGELACLCVRPSHENQGIGRRMVQFVEERAREMGLETLLALSTQAFNFFQSKGGFAKATPEDLPPARREKYEQSGRRSQGPRQASVALPQSQTSAAHTLRYHGAAAGGAASVTFTPCALRRMSSIFQPVRLGEVLALPAPAAR